MCKYTLNMHFKEWVDVRLQFEKGSNIDYNCMNNVLVCAYQIGAVD